MINGETRRIMAVYYQAGARETTLVHAYHFDFPGFGKIKAQGDTCLWEGQQ
jgi:hypothetical protein